MFENLSDGQKKALQVGAPVVAVFALISVLQKRNQPVPTTTTVTGALPANLAPTTDVIGVGQLADFESSIGSAIAQLAQQVGELPTTIPAPIVQSAPSPIAKTLPNINNEWFPVIAPRGEDFSVLGTITGSGYKGYNVGGGVPVYAFQDGQWKQNYDIAKLAVGTPLGTPDTFDAYIDKSAPVG